MPAHREQDPLGPPEGRLFRTAWHSSSITSPARVSDTRNPGQLHQHLVAGPVTVLVRDQSGHK
jgi:hypothetical protein